MVAKGDAFEFVYVSGRKMNLLEDGRLALYPALSEGTLLFDPSSVPPAEVPLSTDINERGVTACRLLPHGHYEAYTPDRLTGDLVPLTGGHVCAYVSNLLPNTTAEMLGRFFEVFDMVVEADIFTDYTGACAGRGWVVLQDPCKLLLVPPVMEFFPQNFIYVALSDTVPTSAMFSSVTDSWAQPPDAVIGPPTKLVPGADRCGNIQQPINNKVKTDCGEAVAPAVAKPLDTSVVSLNAYYFVVVMSKWDAEKSVEAGWFQTEPENRRAFYRAMDRGPVVLIVVLRGHSAVFGFGRLLPLVDNNVGESHCPIEWMKHGVFLEEADLRSPQSLPLAKMRDGIPLKPEIGESICYVACGYPAAVPARNTYGRDGCQGGRRPTARMPYRQAGVRQVTRHPLVPAPRGQAAFMARNGNFGIGKTVMDPRVQF